MSTNTQLMTADELLKLPRGRHRYELIRGDLKTKSLAGVDHGAIAMNVAVSLGQHVKAHRLGVVCAAETGFEVETDPDTVLAPDVAFVRQARIPDSGRPRKFWAGAPDLAVEVLSPGDTVSEVDDKVARWLAAGALSVWVVNPKRRTVTIHHAGQDVVTLSEQDELGDEDVVPGFHLQVSEIFA